MGARIGTDLRLPDGTIPSLAQLATALGVGASTSTGGTASPITSVQASDVGYNNSTSGLAATQVQAAIDELAAGGGGGAFSYDLGDSSAVNAGSFAVDLGGST